MRPDACQPDRPSSGSLLAHTYRECPDGSLEIRNSIGNLIGGDPATDDGWHGYLDEGNSWRQV